MTSDQYPSLRLSWKLISSVWKGSALASTVQETYGNSAKAIGDPVSAEIIYNTVQMALLEDPETVAITVDISNCFNSTRRQQIIQELIQHNMQAELGIMKSMLGYSNPVYHVNHMGQPELLCHNNDGIHQGDPSSPACLTLVLAAALSPDELNGRCYICRRIARGADAARGSACHPRK